MNRQSVQVVVAGVPHGCQDARPSGHWLTEAHVEAIRSVSASINLVETSQKELAAGLLPVQPAEVLLTETSGTLPELDASIPGQIPSALFRLLVRDELRWVQSCSAGVEHLVHAFPDSVILSNAAGNHARALAESALGGILSHVKRFRDRLERQQRHLWEELPCRELRGSTLCVIGTGNIGATVAQLAAPLRMSMIGVRRTPRPTPPFHRVVGPREMPEVLGEADFVVIACPLTPETDGLIGARELALMKAGAYLVNMSRGRVIDQEALLASLRSGQISGAFLDAFSHEPLAETDPLWDAPNVTIIPHDSHSSQLIGDNMVGLFCENLRRYVERTPLLNVVDRSRGY